ncbi:helix-turn-helix domain-containing protein [Bacillus sp. CH30_1T]|uniref:helix-turn-helix domain-containing protein n=1 Tax=Bacillus sp. CH30_1T TaxID=2604836 RepID=UPI00165E5EF3|nr:helix-turn-helix transcriptional regulator [Bacillus sp. CH30_1T]
MSESNIGRDVKELRTKKGIGSRELSRLIGKAETYISQLERGLIKTPDYNTAFEIFKHLGHREDQIEDVLLNFYYIKSPLRVEAEEAWEQQEIENAQDPVYQNAKLDREIEAHEQRLQLGEYSEEEANRSIDWLLDTETDLNNKVRDIGNELNFFIDKKMDVFEDVINNLHTIVMSMSKNKEDYEFFTKLFKRDLSKFTNDSKNQIVETIKEEYKKSFEANGGWGKPPTF